MRQTPSPSHAVCVPHLPFMTIQDRSLNAPFWAAFEARAAALREFDPQIVFVFGSDHYEGQQMASMPTFAIGHAAEAIDDRADSGPSAVPESGARGGRVSRERGIDVATSIPCR